MLPTPENRVRLAIDVYILSMLKLSGSNKLMVFWFLKYLDEIRLQHQNEAPSFFLNIWLNIQLEIAKPQAF